MVLIFKVKDSIYTNKFRKIYYEIIMHIHVFVKPQQGARKIEIRKMRIWYKKVMMGNAESFLCRK